MQKIGDIANTTLIHARKAKEERTPMDPLSSQLVDQVFVKMALICRGFDAFYSDRNRLNAEKTQWILAFTKHGIRSKLQIQHALDKLELHKFPNPPQLGEFMAWCNPSIEDLGFPCVDKAFSISTLMNAQFSNYAHEDDRVDAVIRHAINEIGTFIYRQMNAANAKKTFETYYTIALKQFQSGELKVIPKALPEKANPHPVDRERANAARASCFEQLRRTLGTNPNRR